MAYVFQAWLPLVVWQQVDAPEYRKGFITVTVLSVILIVSTFGAQFLHTGEKLWKGNQSREAETEDSFSDSQECPLLTGAHRVLDSEVDPCFLKDGRKVQ
ncbi:Major facilitator superfamily domaingeneral substrate transporter [Penicillium desertorum]|uniref:Major facilitator superfamily domaingeneral substrate transporter n=1 Tax=Penicillium desertorum TaxID=1303715 RepID=A0A9X0BRW3_9EURO|nr:Major facilitator superfamily domaingeneral substrate transporter [Penicillium desertorum]